MTYAITPFSLGGITSTTDLGLPSTFQCFLLSAWITIQSSSGSGSNWQFQGNGDNPGIIIDIETDTYIISLWDSTNRFITSVSGSFSGVTANMFVNILVSADSVNHHLQVYINDAAQTIANGYVSSNLISNTNGSLATWQTSFSSSNFCVGDIWFANQATFTDLSVTANRRKFINSDLTPVDLGSDGSGPFGTAPPLFLHIPLGGTAADFLTNAGTGGSWTGVASLGFCLAPLSPITSCGTPFGGGFTPTWSQPNTGGIVQTYTIQYRKVGDVSFTTINSISGGNTSFAISGLLSNTDYEWQIQASNPLGSTAFSSLITCTTGRGPTMLSMDALLATYDGSSPPPPSPKVAIFS